MSTVFGLELNSSSEMPMTAGTLTRDLPVLLEPTTLSSLRLFVGIMCSRHDFSLGS